MNEIDEYLTGARGRARRDWKDRLARIHPTHELGMEQNEFLAPTGIPRFYGVRRCLKCAAGIVQHPAEKFIDDELFAPCPVRP
jgi:hypothetical protein